MRAGARALQGAGDRLVPRLVSIDRKSLVYGEEERTPIMEVMMRSPSVFVRDSLPEEGNRLKRLSRKAASEVKRERVDRVGVGDEDESSADRGLGRHGRVPCPQGHSRVQRAGVQFAGP